MMKNVRSIFVASLFVIALIVPSVTAGLYDFGNAENYGTAKHRTGEWQTLGINWDREQGPYDPFHPPTPANIDSRITNHESRSIPESRITSHDPFPSYDSLITSHDPSPQIKKITLFTDNTGHS